MNILSSFTRKDKIIFGFLLFVFFISIILNKPLIFNIAALLYIINLTVELVNYIRGGSNQGIVWSRMVERYENLYGKFFVRILMSLVTIFLIIVFVVKVFRG